MIEIKDLTKRFSKNTVVLNKANLKIEDGKIVGLLGPNGSGKTTLMKIIMGICHSNEGQILIDGKEKKKIDNKDISYLADTNFVDDDTKVYEALKIYKLFYEDFNIGKAEVLLNTLGLRKNSRVRSLSKGMKEKLNLVLVLSREAKLYLLDEPIGGVDIVARKEIIKLIIDNISENSTVIVTTHLIHDIESLFDEVCFIKNGTISEVFNVEEVRINKGKSVEDLYIDYMGGKIND